MGEKILTKKLVRELEGVSEEHGNNSKVVAKKITIGKRIL